MRPAGMGGVLPIQACEIPVVHAVCMRQYSTKKGDSTPSAESPTIGTWPLDLAWRAPRPLCLTHRMHQQGNRYARGRPFKNSCYQALVALQVNTNNLEFCSHKLGPASATVLARTEWPKDLFPEMPSCCALKAPPQSGQLALYFQTTARSVNQWRL